MITVRDKDGKTMVVSVSITDKKVRLKPGQISYLSARTGRRRITKIWMDDALATSRYYRR